MSPDLVDDRVAALEALLERREERIAQLERALGLDWLSPMEWGLTPHENRLFGALMAREVVTRDAGMAVLYRDDGRDEPHAKIFDVFMCKIRKKVAPYGIEIVTRWGVGFALKPESRVRVQALMERARPDAGAAA